MRNNKMRGPRPEENEEGRKGERPHETKRFSSLSDVVRPCRGLLQDGEKGKDMGPINRPSNDMTLEATLSLYIEFCAKLQRGREMSHAWGKFFFFSFFLVWSKSGKRPGPRNWKGIVVVRTCS